MPRAVAFTRVSTPTQSSHEMQLDMIYEYAAKNNLNITEERKLTCSAYSGNITTDYQCTSSHMIFADVSRFSRHVNQGLNFIRRNPRKTIHFVRDGFTSKDISRTTAALEAANQESTLLSMRIKCSKKYKKRRGEYIGGRVPFGLQLIPVEVRRKVIKKYAIDPLAWRVVYMIDGFKKAGYKMREITKELRNYRIGRRFRLPLHRVRSVRTPAELSEYLDSSINNVMQRMENMNV